MPASPKSLRLLKVNCTHMDIKNILNKVTAEEAVSIGKFVKRAQAYAWSAGLKDSPEYRDCENGDAIVAKFLKQPDAITTVDESLEQYKKARSAASGLVAAMRMGVEVDLTKLDESVRREVIKKLNK